VSSSARSDFGAGRQRETSKRGRTHVRPRFLRSRARRLALWCGLLAVAAAVTVGFDLPEVLCLGRARAALDRSELSSAVRWLDRAKAVGRDGRELALLAARIERKLGRLEQAKTALEHVAALGAAPDAVEFEQKLLAAQSGSLPDAQAELASMLAADREPREVAEAFARGDIAAYRLDDAIGLIHIWQEDFPNDPQPHYLAGRVWEHQSDTARAIKELKAGVAANPRHAPSAYNLGRVLLTDRKYKEALEHYAACEEVLYEPLPATLGAVQCLREMGELQAARERLQSIQMPPRDRLEIAYCIVGDPIEGTAGQLDEEWGRLEAAERHWSAAARRYGAALERNPRNWRLRYAYATALRQEGETQQADEQLRLYNEAKSALDTTDRLVDRLRTNPEDVEARYQMGTALLKHVSESQGLFWLNSVLAYDPMHGPTHGALADYYASKADKAPQFARLAAQHRRLAGKAASDEP
jgi:tetratricopeptide (TPR) repeat protein